MRDRLVFAVLFLLISAAIFHPVQAADEILVKQVMASGKVETVYVVHDIFPISANNSLAVASISEPGKKLGLYALKLSYKGKIKRAKQLLELDTDLEIGSVAWLPPGAASSPPGTGIGGILFCYQFLDPVGDRNPKYKRLTISSVPFDVGGPLAKPSKVFEFTANEYPYIEDWPFSVFAAAGGQSVGVVCSFGIRGDDKNMRAFFFETDRGGSAQGKTVELPLVDDGAKQNAWVSRPAWYKAIWLIAIRTETAKDHISTIFNDLPAAQDDGLDFNISPVRSQTASPNDGFGTGEKLQLLPVIQNTGPTAGSDLTLLVQRFSHSGDYMETITGYLHTIGGDGTVAKKSKRVKIARIWEHWVKLEPGEEYSTLEQFFGRAALLGDGRVVLPLIRNLTINQPGVANWRYFSEVSFVALDPSNGRIEVLASVKGDFGGPLEHNGFGIEKGRIVLAAFANGVGEPYVDPNYIFSYKLK